MSESTHQFASTHARNQRTIWVSEPRDPTAPCDLIVFLDGEYFREFVGAADILENWTGHGSKLNAMVVYVSHHSEAARWIECPCHPPFADFVSRELLPWIEQLSPAGAFRRRVLVGLSYTGLAAAYIALHVPECFDRVIAQSGSFWSNDCWLAAEYAKLDAPVSTDFYLDVGTGETRRNVRHKEDVLQVISQIEGVQGFRDALLATGHRVKYLEFEGGHDFAAWKRTLPGALRWALQP